MLPLLESIDYRKKFFIMNFVINLGRKELTKMEADKMKKIIFAQLWKYDI
jgi:hypothetical protein